MRILPYMDDYLALFPSQEEAVRGAVQMKTTLLRSWGWKPTQRNVSGLHYMWTNHDRSILLRTDTALRTAPN